MIQTVSLQCSRKQTVSLAKCAGMLASLHFTPLCQGGRPRHLSIPTRWRSSRGRTSDNVLSRGSRRKFVPINRATLYICSSIYYYTQTERDDAQSQ
jgi:hypothetical protein